MRIGIISPLPPYRGGIAQFSARLADSLSLQGHNVRGISFSRLYPSFLFPGKTQYRDDMREYPQTDFTIDSLWPYSWIKTRKRIQNMTLDKIVVAWWHPFFSLCIRSVIPSGIPSAALCHNVKPHEGFPLGGLFSKLALSKMSVLVVHSETELIESREFLKAGYNIIKLYHPLYEQYLQPELTKRAAREKLGYDDEDLLVLFFGLVRGYKGLEDLLDAISYTDKVKLLIAGESYIDEDKISSKLSSPRLKHRVRWINRFVPDDEVAYLFEAADIVALPYRQATQSGIGQIALSFAKPMVVTRAGGLPELIVEGVTGYAAEPGDPTSIRLAIEKTLLLAQKSDTLDEIRKHARNFDWNTYARELLEAF